MKTCSDCGCRVYDLGCVNCHEAAYIARQCHELGLCARCGFDVDDCRCDEIQPAEAAPQE